MKCKYCNVELLRYTEGGHIFKGYPYESGYYCPKCHVEWSDLQIARGEHLQDYEKIQKEKKELEKFMKTPQDISKRTLKEQANTLTLHFIRFTTKPIGIAYDTYEKCLEAFNNHRGQFEWEMEAILEVLKENKE